MSFTSHTCDWPLPVLDPSGAILQKGTMDDLWLVDHSDKSLMGSKRLSCFDLKKALEYRWVWSCRNRGINMQSIQSRCGVRKKSQSTSQIREKAKKDETVKMLYDKQPLLPGIEKCTARQLSVTSPVHSPASVFASAEHEPHASEPPVRSPARSSRSLLHHLLVP